jgi:hypothetical protein
MSGGNLSGGPGNDRSRVGHFERFEVLYRWLGWLPAVVFAGMAPAAPNVWLALALWVFAGCLLGHWVIERLETWRGRTLMWARLGEAALLFIAVPVLALTGGCIWALEALGGP